eukprot:gene8780-biopygen4655
MECAHAQRYHPGAPPPPPAASDAAHAAEVRTSQSQVLGSVRKQPYKEEGRRRCERCGWTFSKDHLPRHYAKCGGPTPAPGAAAPAAAAAAAPDGAAAAAQPARAAALIIDDDDDESAPVVAAAPAAPPPPPPPARERCNAHEPAAARPARCAPSRAAQIVVDDDDGDAPPQARVSRTTREQVEQPRAKRARARGPGPAPRPLPDAQGCSRASSGLRRFCARDQFCDPVGKSVQCLGL